MDTRLTVSSSPHITARASTRSLMTDVCIALLPACAAGIYFFGAYVIAVIAVSVAAAVLSEYFSEKCMKRKVTITDMSAVVTGLLVALNMPPSVPLYIPIVGSAFAIIIVKQCFGGIGDNFMNPAMAARAMLLISWPAIMTVWAAPAGFDGISSATPLGLLDAGRLSALPDGHTLLNMFLGVKLGCIGETSVLALLIGAVWLFARRVVTPRIPAAYIGSSLIFSLLFLLIGGETGTALLIMPIYHILAGGLMLGAIFMATDYTTTPVTAAGQIIFGCGCGLINMLIRFYGGYPEGVTFAILLMNIATPLIDRYVRPKPYGRRKANA